MECKQNVFLAGKRNKNIGKRWKEWQNFSESVSTIFLGPSLNIPRRISTELIYPNRIDPIVSQINQPNLFLQYLNLANQAYIYITST